LKSANRCCRQNNVKSCFCFVIRDI
jgi:hypothetical protein